MGLTHSSDSQREREQGEKNQGVSNETMVVGDSRLYPTAEEIKDVRTKLTDREVKRIINRAASRQGKEEWPESVLGPISQEQALRLLNEAVRTRIPASGSAPWRRAGGLIAIILRRQAAVPVGRRWSKVV